MPLTVGIREARARLFELVRRAEQGESVAITRNGREVARLDPPRRPGPRRGGWLKSELSIAPDFDAMPEEVIGLFEGTVERP